MKTYTLVFYRANDGYKTPQEAEASGALHEMASDITYYDYTNIADMSDAINTALDCHGRINDIAMHIKVDCGNGFVVYHELEQWLKEHD